MNEDGIIDVCNAFGLRSGHPHGGSRGLNISISCPLAPARHNDPDDYNTSCSVSISDDSPSLAKCFSFNCGYKGSFYKMLEQAVQLRKDPPELVALLAKIAPTERFTLESTLARGKQRYEAALAEMRRPAPYTVDQEVLPEGRITRFQTGVPRYALDRGMTIETCKAWGMGYDKPNKRLVFPVRKHDGKLVGISGRDITGQAEAKYHNYAGLDKAKYLFGEHMLQPKTPVVICEGQIDAILTWQALDIPAVASLGEGFSRSHVRTICAFEPPTVFIFTDNDAAGRLAAEKIEYALRKRVSMKLMLPPAGMDPGDLTPEEIRRGYEAAIPIMGRIRWSDIEKADGSAFGG